MFIGCLVEFGQANLKAIEAQSGSVRLIQRFGSAANLNIHLYCLVLAGVYLTSADGLAPNVKWRSKVVPQASKDTKLLTATPAATDSQEPAEHGRPMRLGWVKLLKRAFNLDLTHCLQCGG
jgi:Putative transposase